MTRSYDPEDADQVAERQKTDRLLRQQGEADLEWMLAAPQGRRVLAWVLQQSNLLAPTFRAGDSLGSAYAEGQRSIGLLVYSAARSVRQGALLEALMAEVMSSSNVGNRRPARPERDAAGE